MNTANATIQQYRATAERLVYLERTLSQLEADFQKEWNTHIDGQRPLRISDNSRRGLLARARDLLDSLENRRDGAKTQQLLERHEEETELITDEIAKLRYDLLLIESAAHLDNVELPSLESLRKEFGCTGDLRLPDRPALRPRPARSSAV